MIKIKFKFKIAELLLICCFFVNCKNEQNKYFIDKSLNDSIIKKENINKKVDSIKKLYNDIPVDFYSYENWDDTLSLKLYLSNIELFKTLLKVADEKEILKYDYHEIYRLIHIKSFKQGYAFFSIINDYKNKKYYFSKKIIASCFTENSTTVKYNGLFYIETWNIVLYDSLTKEITQTEWNEFEKLINGSYFWSMQKYLNKDHSRVEMDPEAFIFEGFENNDYFYINRQALYDGTFRELCMKFYEFSNLKYDRWKGFDE